MAKGYLTRFKLRQGHPKLNKLVKEAVTAFNNLLEYDIESATEKDMTETFEFLSDVKDDVDEDPKIEARRNRFLRIIEEIVNNEEPGESDEEEENEEEEIEEGEEEEEEEKPVETDEEEEEESEEPVDSEEPVETLSNTEENARNESLANLADTSVTAANRTFTQAVKELEIEANEVAMTQESPSNLSMNASLLAPDCVAQTSVTAANISQMMKELRTPKSLRNSNLPEDFRESETRKSLASLLTSAPATPLRSIHSASAHSMFAEETLSRRARRSSQDLAQMILYSDRGQKTPCNTLSIFDTSVVCLGSVKKPTPPLITIYDSPRRTMAPVPNETPKTTCEFTNARARLRRVIDSPVEKEVGRLQTLPESPESPRVTTDYRNVSMDICSPSPPRPAARTRHGTPMPMFGRK